ncbi:metal-dependent hydrolase [Halopiger goleimassiliensis]|uniref:metal-dependent hydrolase n=1 Tax=Halopiger goleimassiliensis TaxID=1293048 RepID=UPI0006782D72|nr:metal-dependent hydrolase [Halopiger goleimassiliensis]
MAPTLVNVAVGVLLGLALLGAAADRRSVLVVALAAALPDLDAVASLVVHGTTNALLHTLLLPGFAFVVLYWDTRYRDRSWLAARYGWYGVRVAWVTLAAFVVAGIGLDLFGSAGVALLYPLHDRFYTVAGRFLLSSDEGVILTFVDSGELLPLESPGTTAEHHVATWVNPTPGTGLETGLERELHLVTSGWQLVVVATAAVAAAVRLRERGDR